jgi:hypothetical protein
MTTRRPTALLATVALLPALVAGAAAAVESAQLRTGDLVFRGTSAVLRTPVGDLRAGRIVGLRDVQATLAAEDAHRADAVTAAVVTAGLLLLVGLVLAWLVARAWRATAPAPDGDREALVRACIDVAETVDSRALRRRLHDALATAGVQPLECADGERFDAARQRAVDRVPTRDPALRDRLAGTARAGWVDRGHVLRAPDVLVYAEARDAR